MEIPFIGQAYENRSIPVANQKCINLFPEIETQDSRNVITLQSVSGVKLFKDLNISSVEHIRGMHFSDALQLLFVVSGTVLYQINEAGVVTSRGTILGSTDVIMADNGTQVGIANGLQYYVYTASTATLASVTDSGAGALVVRDIAFLDGRFILMTTDQRFFITSVNAAQTVSALDFDDVVGNPDDLAGMVVANRRIYFFGTDSFDVYFNSVQAAAAGDFPMVRVDGAAKNGYGLAGLYAKTVQDSAPYWCSNDGCIYMANSYQPQRISNFGVENSLRKYTRLDDCQASSWIENGHRFVAFSFPAGGETWIYDTTSQMWHQRATGLSEAVWSVNYTAQCWNQRNMVGSRSEDKIGELDLELFTEYGAAMKARRTSPVSHAKQNTIFYSRIELLMEVGRAKVSEDPDATLRWSDDGGVTFGNPITLKMGKIGEYSHRLVAYSLGAATNRVWDFQISDNVPRTLIQVIVDAEVGEV
jgi:hypothetical protein